MITVTSIAEPFYESSSTGTHLGSNEISYTTSTATKSTRKSNIDWNAIKKLLEWVSWFKCYPYGPKHLFKPKIIESMWNTFHHVTRCYNQNQYEKICEYIRQNVSDYDHIDSWMEQSLPTNYLENTDLTLYLMGNIRIWIHSICGMYDINSNPHSIHVQWKRSETRFRTETIDTYESNRKHFSFGERYWYWDWYKTHDHYVKKRYKNLKQELLNKLNKYQYESVLKRAKFLLTMNIAKETVVANTIYRLQLNIPIQLENIIVVYIYCSNDEICYKLSKTFRRLNKNESLFSMKKRNSKYWWISRILRETIECYGKTMAETVIKNYYHGVDKYLIFNLFIASLKGPVSCTTSVDVAVNFAGTDGVIVEFAEYSPKLTYFNCTWISPYPGEQERLFCGGRGKLQVINIRIVNMNANNRVYVQAIRHPLKYL